MTQHFPDCMMPDGAEPCKAYQELQAEVEQLKSDLELRNQTALDRKEIIIKLETEIKRLRAELVQANDPTWPRQD